MKMEVNGQTFYVDWFYFRNAPRKTSFTVPATGKGHPIAVECRITLPGFQRYSTGGAFCDPRDKFNKEFGRKLSLARALEKGNFTKDARRQVWEHYRSRTENTCETVG